MTLKARTTDWPIVFMLPLCKFYNFLCRLKNYYKLLIIGILNFRKKQQPTKARQNSENHESDSDEENVQNGDSHNDSETETSEKSQKKNDKKRKKNSSKKKDKQKLKKETRELRAKAMSEGLEDIDFSSAPIPNGISLLDEPMENGHSEEAEKTDNVKKHKRSHANSTDVPTKKKKKNAQNGN